MTDSDLISRHIAERGVTRCPPVYLVASYQASQPSSAVPQTDASGRKRGAKQTGFAKSHADAVARKARMRAEYEADPTIEKIKSMAAALGIGPDQVRKHLRAAGVVIGPRYVAPPHRFDEHRPERIAEIRRLSSQGVPRRMICKQVKCSYRLILAALG